MASRCVNKSHPDSRKTARQIYHKLFFSITIPNHYLLSLNAPHGMRPGIYALLEEIGITPDQKLAVDDYEGLPMPTALW